MDSGDPQLYVVGLFFNILVSGGVGRGESTGRKTDGRSI